MLANFFFLQVILQITYVLISLLTFVSFKFQHKSTVCKMNLHVVATVSLHIAIRLESHEKIMMNTMDG